MTRLFSALQIIAVLCLTLSALQFIEIEPPYDPMRDLLVVLVLAIALVIGVLWWVRSRISTSKARGPITLIVAILATVATSFGHIGLGYPMLMLAMCFVVLDCGLKFAIRLSVIQALTWFAIIACGSSWPLWLVIANALPIIVMAAFGTVLGTIVLKLQDLVALQEKTIGERDVALSEIKAHAAVEKELVLAKERERAAQELHDGLGHQLTLVGMQLEFAERMKDKQADAAWSEVAAARSAAKSAMHDMRQWVRALAAKPGMSSSAASFEQLADSYRSAGLNIQIDFAGVRGLLDESIELILVRALQESLTNAVQHAKTKTVQVTVETSGELLSAEIVNDIAPHMLDNIPEGEVGSGSGPRMGMGIAGMASRLARVGGTVTAGRRGTEFVTMVQIPHGIARPDPVHLAEQAKETP